MHPLHLGGYCLVAGLMLMSFNAISAYTRLKNIEATRNRLRLFQRVGAANAVLLLISVVLFFVIR